MTKEEIIEQHWGHLYPQVKHLLAKDGSMRCDSDFALSIFYNNGDYDFFSIIPEYGQQGEEIGVSEFIPRTLEDALDNNGWTKYVDENTWPQNKDLLYDACTYHKESDVSSEPLKIHRRLTAIEVINLCNEGIITHWRVNKEEPKPIY